MPASAKSASILGPSIPPKIDWPSIKVERSSQRGVGQGTDAGVVAGDAETQGGSAVANVEPLVWLADFQARLHLILNRMCFRPEPRRRWLRDATRAATDLQRVNGVSCGSSREMAPGRLASMWVLSVLHRQRAGPMPRPCHKTSSSCTSSDDSCHGVGGCLLVCELPWSLAYGACIDAPSTPSACFPRPGCSSCNHRRPGTRQSTHFCFSPVRSLLRLLCGLLRPLLSACTPLRPRTSHRSYHRWAWAAGI